MMTSMIMHEAVLYTAIGLLQYDTRSGYIMLCRLCGRYADIHISLLYQYLSIYVFFFHFNYAFHFLSYLIGTFDLKILKVNEIGTTFPELIFPVQSSFFHDLNIIK